MTRPSTLATFLCIALLASAATAQPSFVTFESGPVRPVDVSPDGTQLFVANTPDGQLEIYDVDITGLLTHATSVQVGLEPVAVAARSNGEVWVVNYLSDSVSVVRLTPTPHVERTLLVGDEPSDIVFAGPGDNRAFITTAHRGQQLDRVLSLDGDPRCDDLGDASCFANGNCSCSEPDVEGIGRADVWVFDAASLGAALGGTPLNIIQLFGDKPRALARSADGSKVYAAVFHSGNHTTVVNEGLVCDTSSSRLNNDTVQPNCTIDNDASDPSPGGSPPPHKNHAGDPNQRARPETSLILKWNRDGGTSDEWQDELGRDWSNLVRFDLPDRDVFEIDANANPPAAVDGSSTCINGAGCWAGVGTILLNMAVNPISGKIYVANTDAQNHVRFEGPGIHANGTKPFGEPDTVQGNLAQTRITVLDGANVDARHLNKHIDYSVRPAPTTTRDKSLATPLGIEVTPDGTTLYVAAFGSNKIGVFDTTQLENDTFVPSATDPIQLSGAGGPAGIRLLGNRLYVLTRFDNTIRVISTVTKVELQSIDLHDQEPDVVAQGRPFLYDAVATSSNGEASCASCHIFGDFDSLAWDLGNPDDNVAANTNPFNPVLPPIGDPLPHDFHPMKGPMTTQSLRGLENMGPEHWRGDRQGDEISAFEAFNVAFPGLVGRAGPLTGAEMTQFRQFALEIRYPPNPVRRIDNALRPDESLGRTLYNGPITDTIANCNDCHTLDASNGHFGGDGQTVFDGSTQHLKIPHLRNNYQKVGMFGMAQPENALVSFTGDFSDQGDQVRGFGFVHDGSVDSLARFMGLDGFDMSPGEEAQMSAFVLAFDTDLAPVVGQQITLTTASFGDADVNGRIDLFEARAGAAFTSEVLGGATTDCDLVARVVESGQERGYLYDPNSGDYDTDDAGPAVTSAALRGKAQTPGQEVTFTAVPPGSGHRMALDRDGDTLLNGVETDTGVFISAADTGTDPGNSDTDGDGFDDDAELAAGTNPNNAASFPGAQVPSLSAAGLVGLLLALCAVSIAALRRQRAAR